ncbi:ABC transporter permease [Devosia psychrophila]|jgi:simple sugar transport system permease protein|uniref:Simple sugar transport system permease protein n=1 Tax=Devosia psychrophila TaxID=728005 RepID=A0A0F5PY35_9HYPH|nr:ABC transporter permease [Devosia psychrophila]KKC33316.1 sugar ABC transporter permease [Devosia psychrophila]SFC22637.1 simple sugar transport system permease protein [Devosia psychrophila]
MKRLHLERLANPQLLALAAVLLINWALFPNFFRITWQDGRLFGSAIDVLNRGAPVAILAIGMTGVIATKGVDLSVGAIMAVCGAVAATMVVAGYPTPIAVTAALGVGIVCGLWNGFLVAVLDIQPIIATLVLMVAGRGIAQLITEGYIVTFNDPTLIFIGTGSLLGFPMAAVIALVLMILVTLVVKRTAIGLFIQAIGVNRSAASLAGINSRILLMLVYGLSGFCAAIAGILVAADIRGADANNSGLWLELDAILAVVIGGTSLLGGKFSIPLAVVGAIIIQAMNTGILVSGFRPEFNLIVKAGMIILILMLQSPLVGTAVGFFKRDDKRVVSK